MRDRDAMDVAHEAKEQAICDAPPTGGIEPGVRVILPDGRTGMVCMHTVSGWLVRDPDVGFVGYFSEDKLTPAPTQ